MDIRKEFRKEFRDFNFHHKDLVCFDDAVNRNAVETFIIKALAEQKQEIVEKIEKRIDEEELCFYKALKMYQEEPETYSWHKHFNTMKKNLKDIIKEIYGKH